MGRNIIVTGATSGFGKAIAGRFAKNGDNLIICGRRKERLDAIKQDWEAQYNIKVTPLQFDIRNKEEVIAAFDKLKQTIDHIDILVNNAGLASGLSSIEEGNTDDWDLMIDTNLKGLLYVTRQIAPMMKEQGSGHIINIGSTAGKIAYRNGNVYCATKYGVEALNQSMRIDLLPYGIKVTGINPGMAETEFSIVRFKGDEERAKKVYEGVVPLTAEDVADAVFYCANLPKHVCVNDLTISCLTQANSFYNVKQADLQNQK